MIRQSIKLRHLLYLVGCLGCAIGLVVSVSGALSVGHHFDMELFYKKGAATLDARGEFQKAAEWRRESHLHGRMKNEGMQHAATIATLAGFVFMLLVTRSFVLKRIASSASAARRTALLAISRSCVELVCVIVIGLAGSIAIYCVLIALVAIGRD